MRLLLESNADVNKTMADGTTALWAACGFPYSNNPDTVRLLIESKADIDIGEPHQRTPLWTALRAGKTEIARLLIESKADIHKGRDDGWTPLVVAASLNQLAIVRLLVESGADTKICVEGNRTPADVAMRYGFDAVAEYLNAVRYQPSSRNESGELHKELGRAKRAATRDLKELAGFDDHMMQKLAQFSMQIQ